MRTIPKAPEPSCLAGLRREAARIERDTSRPPTGGDWEPKDCGDAIRRGLWAEQSGLCAYCMRRMQPTGCGMKIEHFVARSAEPRRMYDWDNLLGVCDGVWRGGPAGEVYTCDTHRGDRKLHVHPASESPPRPEEVFRFAKDGRVEARGTEAGSDCETLNLNATPLVEARQQVIRGLRRRLMSDDSARAITRLIAVFETPGRDHSLPEHARLAAEYLRRKLRARGRN